MIHVTQLLIATAWHLVQPGTAWYDVVHHLPVQSFVNIQRNISRAKRLQDWNCNISRLNHLDNGIRGWNIGQIPGIIEFTGIESEPCWFEWWPHILHLNPMYIENINRVSTKIITDIATMYERYTRVTMYITRTLSSSAGHLVDMCNWFQG